MALVPILTISGIAAFGYKRQHVSDHIEATTNGIESSKEFGNEQTQINGKGALRLQDIEPVVQDALMVQTTAVPISEKLILLEQFSQDLVVLKWMEDLGYPIKAELTQMATNLFSSYNTSPYYTLDDAALASLVAKNDPDAAMVAAQRAAQKGDYTKATEQFTIAAALGYSAALTMLSNINQILRLSEMEKPAGEQYYTYLTRELAWLKTAAIIGDPLAEITFDIRKAGIAHDSIRQQMIQKAVEQLAARNYRDLLALRKERGIASQLPSPPAYVTAMMNALVKR